MNYASTKEYLQDLCEKVFGPGMSGFDNVLVDLPGQGHMSLIKSLIEARTTPYTPNDILIDYFKDDIESTYFIFINPSAYSESNPGSFYEDFLTQITKNKQFESIAKDRDEFLNINIPIARQKIPELIGKITHSSNIFIIFQPVLFLKSIPKEIIDLILSYKSLNNNKIKLILSVSRIENNDLKIAKLSKQITYIKPLPKEEVFYQCEKLFVELGKDKPNKESMKAIFELSGGLAGIMKALILEYASGNRVTSKLLKENDVTQNYTLQISKLLKPDERNTLSKITRNEKVEIDQNSFIAKSGITELPAELISEILNATNTDSPINMTPTLLKIYKLLEQNEGKLVSKSEIAQCIWGEKYTEKYSDWALDRFISDLRKTLTSKETITTKKGQGYIFKSSLS